jgi:hypothetical protein
MGRSAFEGVNDGEWAVFAEKVVAERDEARDCGQDVVCAIAPGCQRHWAERAQDLLRERDEARADVRLLELSNNAKLEFWSQAERELVDANQAVRVSREAAACLLDEEHGAWPYGSEISAVLARLAEAIRELPVEEQ